MYTAEAVSAKGGDGASTSGEGPVIAACVLQRLPLVRPRLSSEEQAQLAWERQRALQTGELKDYPQDLVGCQDQDAHCCTIWHGHDMGWHGAGEVQCQRQTQSDVS